MTEEFLLSPWGQLLFVMVWTCIATLFAWLGLREIRFARQKREFRVAWVVTVREAQRPWQFKFQLAGLIAWTVIACAFVPIGLVFVVDAVLKVLAG